jgi:putative ATP-binding cassette transporter
MSTNGSSDTSPPRPLLWGRFRRAVRDFAASEVGGRGKLLFAGLIGFLLLISALNVVNSYVGRDFMTAIAERDRPGFVRFTVLYLAVFALSTLVAGVYRFTEERLGVLWRESMTKQLIASYLRHPTYYRLNDRLLENGEIANPDQRIADDVRAFTATALSFALMLTNGTITALAFAAVMWDISPRLFAIALAYAAVGSLVTVRLGLPLMRLNNHQLDREAELRAALAHLREHGESVALLRHEEHLHERLLRGLGDVTANFRRMIGVNLRLGLFTNGYNYLLQIIPAVVVAPLYFRGEVEFGVITQSAMAFSQLLGAISLVVTQFQSISSFGAVVGRLDSLGEALERARSVAVASAGRCEHDRPTEECPICRPHLDVAPGVSAIHTFYDADRVAYEHLTLRSARDARALIEDLTIEIAAGTRVQIVGSAAARMALFRATAGIWDTGAGRLVRPRPGEIMFLPERPYAPPGTLREMLNAPGSAAPRGDAEIAAVLSSLHLESLAPRAGGLDNECPWHGLLSLGEQHLLGVARMVLAAPRFVFFDRPQSALSVEQLERVLAILSERSITYLTICDEPTAADRYDAILELAADGGWKWKPVARVCAAG